MYIFQGGLREKKATQRKESLQMKSKEEDTTLSSEEMNLVLLPSIINKLDSLYFGSHLFQF